MWFVEMAKHIIPRAIFSDFDGLQEVLTSPISIRYDKVYLFVEVGCGINQRRQDADIAVCKLR